MTRTGSCILCQKNQNMPDPTRYLPRPISQNPKLPLLKDEIETQPIPPSKTPPKAPNPIPIAPAETQPQRRTGVVAGSLGLALPRPPSPALAFPRSSHSLCVTRAPPPRCQPVALKRKNRHRLCLLLLRSQNRHHLHVLLQLLLTTTSPPPLLPAVAASAALGVGGCCFSSSRWLVLHLLHQD